MPPLCAVQECRKIVGKTGDPLPGQFPAQHADVDVENYIYEQLINAAGAVHDEVCRERIIAFEEAAANAPVVTPLSPIGPTVPKIGENLPAVPAVRGLTLDEDMRFEDVVEDGAKAARVHLERARIVTGQVAANASVHAQRIAKQTVEGIFVRASPSVALLWLQGRPLAASTPSRVCSDRASLAPGRRVVAVRLVMSVVVATGNKEGVRGERGATEHEPSDPGHHRASRRDRHSAEARLPG